MYKLIYAFILMSLLLSSIGYAELKDPTRPLGFITSSTAVITTWQLDAIIIADDRKTAIINGQAVSLGEKIGENRLVSIEPNSVQLEGIDGKITLFLLDSSLKMDLQAN
jgi:hypothetical protein